MPTPPPSAFSDFNVSLDRTIDEFFGLHRNGLTYSDKRACVQLCKSSPFASGPELIGKLWAALETDLSRGAELGPARGSELWRWKKNCFIAPENTQLEVRIERAIVRLLDDRWVNQVPAASGLSPLHDNRRSVDLAYRHDPKQYDLIELKALTPGKLSSGQQSPLFAAMEVIKYGLLFLFSRKHHQTLFPGGVHDKPMLGADVINLEVLMTPNCYLHSENRGLFHIAWLNRMIGHGIQALNKHSKDSGIGVSFTFSFKQFPRDFVWTDEDHFNLLSSTTEHPSWRDLKRRISDAVEYREPAILL